jgi:hypothetical protein
MGKNSYLGGSSIIGPGANFFRPDKEDGNAARIIGNDLLAQMAEDDDLRAKGINPIAHAKALKQRAKAHRRRLKAEIKALENELESLRSKRNAI